MEMVHRPGRISAAVRTKPQFYEKDKESIQGFCDRYRDNKKTEERKKLLFPRSCFQRIRIREKIWKVEQGEEVQDHMMQSEVYNVEE